MKKSLADRIEEYLKVLIARTDKRQIEIQRSELAETFNCVPSQVTYVISTRFTENHGYITESRRGGKGFVRISRFEEDFTLAAVIETKELFEFIELLWRSKAINDKERQMLEYLIKHVFGDLPPGQKSKILEKFRHALEDFIKLY